MLPLAKTGRTEAIVRIARLTVENFRGIASGKLLFAPHCVLVGDNNTGKSTILEAVDLVLGPERLSRQSPIDEHDFYGGRYISPNNQSVEIKVEVIIVDLSPEQQRHFKDHLEWWHSVEQELLNGPPAEKTDDDNVLPALRVGFRGWYDADEDDFSCETYFLSPLRFDGTHTPFKTADKRLCGFLFLRTLRTGSRALSLERGSLLDIILRLKEIRLQMWEDVLKQLRVLPVADKPELGLSEILSSVQEAVRSLVPSDWADSPHLRVSELTRENLRRVLTVFMATGAKDENGVSYAAPFQHQGTGTINTLVLAMLSLIAEIKQNVIFAMEEPEIAIPPHTQKRIVESVRKKSAQSLFTSHSPYILEEFEPSEILVLKRDSAGVITGVPASFPSHVKRKQYRQEFRRGFAEALLARRILLTEGRTEFDAYPAAARRLHELNPTKYKTLESLGMSIFDAATETQIAPLGEHFRSFGKAVFAVFDKQKPEALDTIKEKVDFPFEAPEENFETIILKGTSEAALRRYADSLTSRGEWPPHLKAQQPTASTPLDELRQALGVYFNWAKGSGSASDLLSQCAEEEMPVFIRETLAGIVELVEKPLNKPNPEPLANVVPESPELGE